MMFPLHRIEIETDSERQLYGEVQRELLSVPKIVKQEFSEQEWFAFRLVLEEYVVELLKERRSAALRSRHGIAGSCQLSVLFEQRQILISCNGQEKVLQYPEDGPVVS
ncbi:hypothetical protein [Gimesia chilikensis]|uniref:hypothetical protein n=1 Tax=Gimesia chilikensis TaxID=2605989 RepID=UPI00118B5452|nr:hypothetical protein [Gimesia chilikensis]QDT86840.1 hypothetical protein MalM14_45190 [Gimesia chilikensis]